ncbi:MAG: ATP-binding cassette domain-containing protein [Alphaproteobacteria bacterium]|nr:ATP-binding cassette domain-containing protein [Alphaproteobacteria bacterium]
MTASDPDSALVAGDIVHAFGTEAVLDGLSLTLPQGEVGCLIGRSGCGKTTLLSILGRLLTPCSGTIRDPFHRPAFVFQDPCLLPWRNLRDNIAFGLTSLPLSRTERHARAERLITDIGFTPRDAEKFPHQLSGGMRQRTALARALAIEPDLLLLDEPFNALDAGLRRLMHDLVRPRVARGRLTVLMVTHDLTEAAQFADRIFVMSPRPARIVAEHRIATPSPERDGAFVYAEVSRLLADAPTAQALLR